MYLGYAVFYFTRKSFNFAMPDMLASGMLNKADIGMLWTLFYITYGCSKFFSGIISDRANPRYFMGLGLMATGVINILFGLSSSLWLFAALWVANAFFQGWGWPLLQAAHQLVLAQRARLLVVSLEHGPQRGRGAHSPHRQHPGPAARLALRHDSARPYRHPRGVVPLLAAARYPGAMGLPTVGEWRNDAMELAQQTQDAGLSHRQILRKYVLGNPYIWLLACCYVLVYVVRTAINDWGNLYMTEQRGFNLMSANSAISMFEVGALSVPWWQAGDRTSCSTATAGR